MKRRAFFNSALVLAAMSLVFPSAAEAADDVAKLRATKAELDKQIEECTKKAQEDSSARSSRPLLTINMCAMLVDVSGTKFALYQDRIVYASPKSETGYLTVPVSAATRKSLLERAAKLEELAGKTYNLTRYTCQPMWTYSIWLNGPKPLTVKVYGDLGDADVRAPQKDEAAGRIYVSTASGASETVSQMPTAISDLKHAALTFDDARAKPWSGSSAKQ